MHEVHPDNAGQWLLYETGDGGFYLVASFADKEDAEFARQVFDNRASALRKQMIAHDDRSIIIPARE